MTAAAQPQRFNFDLDLARTRATAQVIEEGELDRLLADARQKGFEDGVKAGELTATARSEEKLANAAKRLGEQGADLIRALDDAETQSRADAVEFAARIARKLAAHLVVREPTAEIAALLSDCMASLETAAHLAVRCHPDLAERIREIVETEAESRGFAGRLVVLGEPDIALGDARIEWADGGVVRDMEQIARRADQIIADYFGRSLAPEPQTASPNEAE